MLEQFQYMVDLYTFGLRTGFGVSDLGSMGCGCFLTEDLAELRADDLHAVMRPATVDVLAHSTVERVNEVVWSISARAEFEIPSLVVEDAQGAEVRQQPATTIVADVVLTYHEHSGDFYVVWWEDDQTVSG